MAMLNASGADGATVSAIDEGEGPAILIVHPGSSDASAWSEVARLLIDEFRVVRIQRRIYASGAMIALPHTMATEAADVLAVAGQLKRPLLVGHSSGAVAALEAALVSPAAFAGMVLYEPPLVSERRGFEEVVLHLDGETGRVDLPLAIVADRESDGRIDELRIYSSTWPLTDRHANRPPLLQPDPELRESDVVAEYQRALAAGDVDAIVAAFEPDGVRPRAGGRPVHPQRPRRPALLLSAALLERRRHPTGTLRAHRRRARVRAGVQRRAVGRDGAAAGSRGRCLRSGSERQARGGPHLR
jgi:pimeloyl-ACP methyl ester carboxylesterase